MKIKITKERECCDPVEDLLPYKGINQMAYLKDIKFCKHCGQLWTRGKAGMDGAGNREYDNFKIDVGEVTEKTRKVYD